MKNLIIAVLIVCLVMPLLAASVYPEKATADQAMDVVEKANADDALNVAENWITLIIQNKGSWGGSEAAEVYEIQEFKRGERVIGFFCCVKPQGFIVVSLYKGLAPVKAYSEIGDLDPESDEGLADLIKGGMERVLDWTEERVGPLDSASAEDLDAVLEINYRGVWANLDVNNQTFEDTLESGEVDTNYQAGQVLLTTDWHQGDPYNRLCPTGDTGCTDCCPTEPGICPPTLPTLVGCVALAGAQIMKHWDWPPYGVGSGSYTWDGDNSCNGPVGAGTVSATFSDTYDWPNMPDVVTGTSPAAQINAVSELCYEVSVAVHMDYGVCGSGAYTSDMEGVYENNYRYSTACTVKYRKDYTAVNWFNRMKAQFNLNRPVHYRIYGHSIVGDGWQEVWIGGVFTRQYHMNYGWSGAARDTWYTLDALFCNWPGCAVNEEYMLENIYPSQALGGSVSGTYPLQPFPYRYFDQDTTSTSATFSAGQWLQFLSDITVTCTSTTGQSIRFLGSPPYTTRLFTRGDTSEGVHIYNGGIKLLKDGSIKFP